MIPTLTLRPTAAGLRSRLDTEDGPIDGVMPPPSRRRLAEPLQRAVNWTSPYAAEAVRQVGAVLEEALAPDVREALEGFPDGALLRLDVARELARLPWEWCHQTGDPIGLRLALARTALGLEPDDDASAHPATGPSPSLLLLANPTGNLPGALDEASAIADAYADAGAVHEVLEGADATAERFIAELQANRWDVVHFAGHGWFDDEESYLVLAGGHRVRASELASLLGRQPPALLLLNTHFSAYVPPGVEVTLEGLAGGLALSPRPEGRDGFTETSLNAGVGSVVGTCGSVSDAVAADVGIAFHQGLLEGLPVAEALRLARRAAPPGEASDPSGMFYTLSGFGDLSWGK